MNNKLFKHAVQVHKFGGSSLASTECINRVVDIIQHNCQLQDIVVVSANGDTTDELIEIYELALSNSEQVHQAIEQLETKQQALIASLLSTEKASDVFEIVTQDIKKLSQWLQLDISEHKAELLAFGESWSASLLAAILSERVCLSYALDARNFLVIDNEISREVAYPESEEKFSNQLKQGSLAVITGFIARDSQGTPCTLGRNGSDYSATIMAALSHAQTVTLWTDVDGIYSADPRVVPLARKLHRVPRSVAKELGRLGNPILHAKTLEPLDKKGSHLHVASSFDPETLGTEVGDFGQIAQQELSVTYLNDLLLAQSYDLQGDAGEEAYHKFSAISGDITKGQLVIRLNQQKGLSEWLAGSDAEVKFTPVSIMAVVGHNIAERGNVKVRFKRALRSQRPIAIFNTLHQDSLVAVLPNACTGETLNTIHHAVTKDARHIGLVIAGLGNIGQRFIELLPEQLHRVEALENVHLVGLVSSRKLLLQTDGIDPERAIEEFECSAQRYEPESLVTALSNHPYDELIVVDITPSETFSHLYECFFEQGIHVIGANKWAGSSPLVHYKKLQRLVGDNKALWLGNTTVGAGLPINHAIEDLIQSGDEILEISGIFSGTLSWLFEKYDGQTAFSELLLTALGEGITEPDPREDLSGRDVQRKLLILARLAGIEMSLEDIDCQNLVPASLCNVPLEKFLARAEELDENFAKRLADAKVSNGCIRYIARLSRQNGQVKAAVGLEVIAQQDAFASLTPCDNIFKVVSHWYQDNPLIIRGPGAGRDVTAGGLHSDLVNACKQLAGKQHQVKLKGIN
ncbi:MAG: bifunctional aspartate kinase/homoserine dehydrogenase II [Thalassotalea sp.]|nr:bifunctional aspartate kinase/homoserine dehydrogenase II [Thalassotalea sp.]